MNRIKFWSTLLLVLCNFGVSAQNFCLTPSNIPEFLQTVPQNKYVKTRSGDTYVVRVFFHIVRQSNGTGGQTTSEVNTAFNILIEDYQPHGICFELLGIDEIHDDNTYNKMWFSPNTNGDGKFSDFNPNSHPDAIDVYLFANDRLNFGVAAGIPASALVIGGKYIDGTNLVTSHVLSHEMGHCLGLYHTFHGLCESGCAELVNGSNCSSCGDTEKIYMGPGFKIEAGAQYKASNL
ncbi:MAG: M43 family zinc metalloprotease [Marinilabiliaceae bacterium]|nr:M43 family zinc metalloprotease [Marinilabiliaceae bacterium]